MSQPLTLYTAKICPYAHRVELALEEANAKYSKYQIDLQNKPQWYAPKVNPASKVPAIAYGGPNVAADQPSPDSTKLAESLVLVEFIADLYPHAHLLPEDPVLRARARFFIDAVSTKLVPAWNAFLRGNGSADDYLNAVEKIQALLAPEGFAVGPYSIADVAVAPFLARAEVALKNDVGAYPEGQGPFVLQKLAEPRFARFEKYWAELQSRPNFKATFDEEYVTEAYKKRFGNLRSQKL
ncbi:glutathione S-transferase C-terminal-like protein [Laetiporus sulphureus 93-53]|uniref:Glutathione S-transferase C-terminal-like protein n=1 Tax=Laetiporus sulphureus 93-53 TaxID=1314785 RepID=A0A165EXP4_9APHY|nr:glutathione S-transferase C-terminal-like protein [Laetiporus sulphureus 93-53]KZT07935.1 glutathione S-transferase C-terminal-like protein [Laetiporus sulphureus 93-53]